MSDDPGSAVFAAALLVLAACVSAFRTDALAGMVVTFLVLAFCLCWILLAEQNDNARG